MSDARSELIDILNQSGPNYEHDAAVDVDAILAHPFIVQYLRHVAAQ